MYTAKDVMTTAVITLTPDSTVSEAIGTLIEHRISGVPVVDGEGQLVGIISEFQLLEIVYTPELRSARISDFMTKEVVSVTESTSLADVTTLFILHRIRRVPVLRDGKLVGMITRGDVLRYAQDANQEIAGFLREARAYASSSLRATPPGRPGQAQQPALSS